MKLFINKLKMIANWFFSRSSKVKLLIAVVVIIALIAVYSKLSSSNTKTQYQTASVIRGNIISTLTESGNVTSMSQTNVGSPTNGVIQQVYVKNGDKVVAGQNLFKVKSTATVQEQASAYANYLSAQNALNSANSKINSLQSALFVANQAFINDKGIQNPTDQQKADPKYIEENANWLQAQADYNNQSGVIAQAEAAYNSAAQTYASTQDSIVTAPIDGTVANFSSNVGSNVTASGITYNNSSSTSSSSSTAPVLVLGNFSNLSVKTPVSEVDISKIRKGELATISLDAYPTKTFVGKVDSVDTIGTNSSGVVTYNAYISFIAPPPTVEPGMTASAVVEVARKDNVLTVPSSSIQQSSLGSYVNVMKNGTLTNVPVTTGISSDTDTEITSGLSVGDKVVTSAVSPISSSNSKAASPFGALGGRGFGGPLRGR